MTLTKNWSLRTQIFVWVLACVALTFMAAFALIATQTRQATSEETYRAAHNLADAYVGRIEVEFAHAYAVAETMAATLYVLRETKPDRALASAINRLTLERNPQFVRIRSYWEPDVFDGKDVKPAGDKPQPDAAGHPAPPPKQAGEESPVGTATGNSADNWYNIPKKTKRPWTSEPYEYMM